jgi:hypothetical protein
MMDFTAKMAGYHFISKIDRRGAIKALSMLKIFSRQPSQRHSVSSNFHICPLACGTFATPFKE